MSKRMVAAVVLAVALGATPALAAEGRGRADWSILGAETVAPGGDVLSGTFGWPDVSFGFTHGVSPGFDVGGRLSFVYGVENTTESQFGMAFAVPLRWALSRHGSARLLLHLDPGLRLYTPHQALFGFQLPIGLVLEFPVTAPLRVGLGADFNASLFVTGNGSPQFLFGPLIGPFLEYHVDPRLAFGVDTRFGAIVDAYSGDFGYSGGTHTRFGFRAQMMLAYHL